MYQNSVAEAAEGGAHVRGGATPLQRPGRGLHEASGSSTTTVRLPERGVAVLSEPRRRVATCLWEAPSVEAIQAYVDSTLGDSSENACYEVDAQQAFAVVPSAISAGPAAARVRSTRHHSLALSTGGTGRGGTSYSPSLEDTFPAPHVRCVSTVARPDPGAAGSCIGSVARAPSRLGEARTCDHHRAEDWCVGRVTAAWEAPLRFLEALDEGGVVGDNNRCLGIPASAAHSLKWWSWYVRGNCSPARTAIAHSRRTPDATKVRTPRVATIRTTDRSSPSRRGRRTRPLVVEAWPR